MALRPGAPAAATQEGRRASRRCSTARSLDGWRGYKKADASDTRWKVENGARDHRRRRTARTRAAGATSSRTGTYDQFDLRWEWKVAPGGNSGLKYFVLEDQTSAIGHEYQMIDDERHADAKIGPHRQTAAFYDVLPAADRPLKPAGEWNSSARSSSRATTSSTG